MGLSVYVGLFASQFKVVCQQQYSLDYQEQTNYPFKQIRKNYDQHSEDDADYSQDGLRNGYPYSFQPLLHHGTQKLLLLFNIPKYHSSWYIKPLIRESLRCACMHARINCIDVQQIHKKLYLM